MPYFEDASGYQGTAERVLTPQTVDEVRSIVRECASRKIPLTVAGAGTGLTGARVPHGGWVVSLEKFRKLQIEKGRAVCGPAISLSELQAAAAQTQQFLGPNPTEISASVGGVISTNAGGARSFHYGALRKHVLALEAVFMDGSVRRFEAGEGVDFPVIPVRVPRTTKNAAGYLQHEGVTWTDLLAGSEGTLAIVTEAELRLYADPGAILSGVVFFPSDDLAQDAVDAWRPVPELRLLEYLDVHALNLLRERQTPVPASAVCALLIEQNLTSEQDPEIDAWADRLAERGALEDDSWFGFSAAERERFRALRHLLPVTVVERVRKNGFPKFGTDFAVPLEKSRELHKFYVCRCDEEFPSQYTIFGHAGDANNHVNLMPATPEQARRGEGLIYEFAEIVVSLGGTVAAEHGIGKTKTDLFRLMYSELEIDAMKKTKRQLDPAWLLGRGTIFGDLGE